MLTLRYILQSFPSPAGISVDERCWWETLGLWCSGTTDLPFGCSVPLFSPDSVTCPPAPAPYLRIKKNCLAKVLLWYALVRTTPAKSWHYFNSSSHNHILDNPTSETCATERGLSSSGAGNRNSAHLLFHIEKIFFYITTREKENPTGQGNLLKCTAQTCPRLRKYCLCSCTQQRSLQASRILFRRDF